MTLAELASEFGVSRERVRQIEVRAFEKVQKIMNNSGNGSGVGTDAENRRPRFFNTPLREAIEAPSCNLTLRFRTGVLTSSARSKLLKQSALT